MKRSFLLLLLTPIFIFSQIVETHKFGATNSWHHIYSDGKTWKFTAGNNMNVETIKVKSVLASTGKTIHIEVSIQNNLIANWNPYINNEQFEPYYHTKQVSYSLVKGDTIVYKIYGNSFMSSAGSISGISYVRLIGNTDN